MTPTDAAAIIAARKRRPLRTVELDESTDFVIRVLDWILAERAGGRLTQGHPVTLVQFDFSPPRAANLGAAVDLHNGGAVAGAIHVCAESLRPAHVLPGAGGFVTIAAHQAAIVQRQLADHTSVSFDPSTGAIRLRLACVSHGGPIDMQLGGQLPPQWQGQELAPLPTAIGAFHAGLTRKQGVGSLLFENDRPSSRARIYYRNAMFLYLRYQLGLRESHGYRVTARPSDVAVTHIDTGRTSLVTAAATGSDEVSVATATIERLLNDAAAAYSAQHAETFINCIACPSSHPPGHECAVPPVSLRHRHVEAA